MWFDEENQEEILLNYLPTGRIYKKAHIRDTNFNKIIQWLAKSFNWLVMRYNATIRGIFICESGYFVKEFMRDYNVPNEIFYSEDNYTHIRDILVMKYLMKGNTKWHFQAIANIYDIDVKIVGGAEYYNIYDGSKDSELVVIFDNLTFDEEPNQAELLEKYSKKIEKIKKIYDIIKQSHIEIIEVISSIDFSERIKMTCNSLNVEKVEEYGLLEIFSETVSSKVGCVGEISCDTQME